MLKKLLVIAVVVLGFFASAQNTEAQTDVKITQSTPTVNSCSAVEGTITFAADSLGHYKLGAINILPYADYFATVSFKVVGTNPVFRINTYLSNFLSTDTTYWNLSQSWDTTGVYTAKPINDTVLNKIGVLPMRYMYVLVKGLANNRKDVRVHFRVVLYRKP